MINLITGEITIMTLTIENLREFLYSPFRADTTEWNEVFQAILNFQNDDGSFGTTDSILPDSDAREESVKYPTMLGSAILMKAFLLFPEKQKTILPRLKKALDVAAHMLDGQFLCINLFISAGLQFFIYRFPNISEEFTKTMISIRDDYRNRIEANDLKEGFGTESYNSLTRYNVFVYGSLMRDEYNHHYVENQIFLQSSEIHGYNLYNLGHYPGIRPSQYWHRVVKGEVYSIDSYSLEQINWLEGEGSLYNLQFAETLIGENLTVVGLYVYNHTARKTDWIMSGDWKERNFPTVYLAYGSNMNLEQMNSRCPGAINLGTAMLENYILKFRANLNVRYVATVDKKEGSRVPVVIWAITKEHEKALDLCEGVSGHHYEKQYLDIRFKGKIITALAYIMPDGRPEGVPETEYYNRIMTGYRENGIEVDA